MTAHSLFNISTAQKPLSKDGSYHAKHPELFKPECVVFLDGVMQSCDTGERAYHEALFHPSIFAHSNPRCAAIIGGGEGATLREMLKHATVKKDIMGDIDEQMVDVSRRYLLEWSDCTNLVGSAKWCGDDLRAEVRYEDWLAYFTNRYESTEQIKDQLFGAIVIDAVWVTTKSCGSICFLSSVV